MRLLIIINMLVKRNRQTPKKTQNTEKMSEHQVQLITPHDTNSVS